MILSIPANNLIEGTNTLKVWCADSDTGTLTHIRISASAEAGVLRENFTYAGGLKGLAATEVGISADKYAGKSAAYIIADMESDDRLSPAEKTTWRQSIADITTDYQSVTELADSLEMSYGELYGAILQLNQTLTYCGVWAKPDKTFDLTTLPSGSNLSTDSSAYTTAYGILYNTCIREIATLAKNAAISKAQENTDTTIEDAVDLEDGVIGTVITGAADKAVDDAGTNTEDKINLELGETGTIGSSILASYNSAVADAGTNAQGFADTAQSNAEGTAQGYADSAESGAVATANTNANNSINTAASSTGVIGTKIQNAYDDAVADAATATTKSIYDSTTLPTGLINTKVTDAKDASDKYTQEWGTYASHGNEAWLIETEDNKTKIVGSAIKTGSIAADQIDVINLAAEKIFTDELAANKIFTDELVATKAFIDELTVDDVFATNIKTVDLKADQITAGKIKADFIDTGTLIADKVISDNIIATSLYALQFTADNITIGDATIDELIVTGNTSLNTLVANKITATDIAASTLKVTTHATIKDLAAEKITVDYLNAKKITADKLTANAISTITLSASKITTGTLDATYITCKNLKANNIDTDTINNTHIDTYNGGLNGKSLDIVWAAAGTLRAGGVWDGIDYPPMEPMSSTVYSDRANYPSLSCYQYYHNLGRIPIVTLEGMFMCIAWIDEEWIMVWNYSDIDRFFGVAIM